MASAYPKKGKMTKTPKRDLGVKDRAGVKKSGATPVRIRSAEWAMKDAQHRANNRAKARKTPTGRIAKALEKKGYSAANVNESEKMRKMAGAKAFGTKAAASRKANAAEARDKARRAAKPKSDNRRSASSRRYS